MGDDDVVATATTDDLFRVIGALTVRNDLLAAALQQARSHAAMLERALANATQDNVLVGDGGGAGIPEGLAAEKV